MKKFKRTTDIIEVLSGIFDDVLLNKMVTCINKWALLVWEMPLPKYAVINSWMSVTAGELQKMFQPLHAYG